MEEKINVNSIKANYKGESDMVQNKHVITVVKDDDVQLIRLDNMYESLRSAEYDINSGLGEIVDNAVESGAQNVWVVIKTEKRKFRNKEIEVIREVAVIDDGCGMSDEILNRCLVLGDTHRIIKRGSKGIGKFGVGLTLGGISLSRTIEVYSRDKDSNKFKFTYLDLNLVKDNKQKNIPKPIPKSPDEEYGKLLENKAGTIVILKNCDRLQFDQINSEKGIPASELISGIPNFLGRTYRKFIYAGLKIWFNGNNVYLHDPLYILGPTKFDVKIPGKQDLKAKIIGKEIIPLDIPGGNGKKAEVIIRMTLLPEEWRAKEGDGRRPHAIERKIDDNEGVSILRANREVLYGVIPYIIGKKGQAKSMDIDRWWGCEISFPPELDEYFTVRYIKRGIEPGNALRDMIREKISPVIKQMRKDISAYMAKKEEEEHKNDDVFQEAEEIMTEVDKMMPQGKARTEITEAEEDKQIDDIVNIVITNKPKEQKKKELTEMPYKIESVSYPPTYFFETRHLLGKIVILLNINHPFYKDVFKPLCGSIDTMNEGSDINDGADTVEKRRNRRAFMLMLLSYAKAEQFFEGSEELLMNLRNQWGIALATALTKANEVI